MSKGEIEMRISLDTGEIRIKANGIKGQKCTDATKFLKDTLGETTDFQRHAEWYERELNESTVGIFNTDLCG